MIDIKTQKKVTLYSELNSDEQFCAYRKCRYKLYFDERRNCVRALYEMNDFMSFIRRSK